MRLLFILLPLLLLAGCTITKRHFGPGYHVEWKKSSSKEENQSDKENQSYPYYQGCHFGKSEITLTAISSPFPIDTFNPEISQESEVIVSEIEADVVSDPENAKFELNEDFPLQIDQSILEYPKEEHVKKTEPLTWVAFILLVGIAVSAGLISMYSSFLYLGASAFLSGLALLLTIFAFISFIRVIRNRDRYKNKGLTYFLFVVSISALLVAGVYFMVTAALDNMGQIM